ncbi:hypothetical protein OG533_24320 [Streptomyces sp. NBC_01186]|uniref:hypothetical protein n=1 Tax=Streptomyces sp. NBC_01186 TaxID=2903765 RepID=UPI002E13F2AB|nr:hypothetical protein OG533_24320 [Streptomyces sp. NBC_01186]
MTDSTSSDTRSSSDLRTSPDTRADDPADALLARLARLRTRVADLVERRSVGDPTADDPLRGLYLSDEAVRHHLRRLADPLPPEGDAGAGHTAEGSDDEPSRDDEPRDAEPRDDELPSEGDRLHWLALHLGLTELDVPCRPRRPGRHRKQPRRHSRNPPGQHLHGPHTPCEPRTPHATRAPHTSRTPHTTRTPHATPALHAPGLHHRRRPGEGPSGPGGRSPGRTGAPPGRIPGPPGPPGSRPPGGPRPG